MSNQGIITMFSTFQNAIEEEKEKKEVFPKIIYFLLLKFIILSM